jgi:hypothetical protein
MDLRQPERPKREPSHEISPYYIGALKQKSTKSQAKHHHPEKSWAAQYGILQLAGDAQRTVQC